MLGHEDCKPHAELIANEKWFVKLRWLFNTLRYLFFGFVLYMCFRIVVG